MVIPRTLVPGLEGVLVADLRAPVVSPAGDGLSYPTLDLDVYVPGLVRHPSICRGNGSPGRATSHQGEGRGRDAQRSERWTSAEEAIRVDVI